MVGLELAGKEKANHGDCVHIGRSQVGIITSGCISPTLNKNIALCRIDVGHSELDTEVEVGKIDGHQKRIPAKIVPFPHYDPKIKSKIIMSKTTKDLLEFWEDQMKESHTSSNYFFRKSPSHYHMMLIVMSAYKLKQNLSVEELKTKLFKTSRPKSALIINEACEKGFFYLEKTSNDQRKKFIRPSKSFVNEFNDYLNTLKNLSF